MVSSATRNLPTVKDIIKRHPNLRSFCEKIGHSYLEMQIQDILAGSPTHQDTSDKRRNTRRQIKALTKKLREVAEDLEGPLCSELRLPEPYVGGAYRRLCVSREGRQQVVELPTWMHQVARYLERFSKVPRLHLRFPQRQERTLRLLRHVKAHTGRYHYTEVTDLLEKAFELADEVWSGKVRQHSLQYGPSVKALKDLVRQDDENARKWRQRPRPIKIIP